MEVKIPYNLEVEQNILGSLLYEDEIKVRRQLFPQLRKEYFYRETHQVIFELLEELYSEREDFTLLDVANEIKKRNLKVNPNYLVSLYTSIPTPKQGIHFLPELLRLYQLRQLSFACYRVLEKCQDHSSFAETLAILETEVDKVISQSPKKTPTALQIAEAIVKEWDEGESGNVYSSGYPELDEAIGGFADSRYIIIGARTSMGKTSFCLNLALNFAKQGYSSCILSVEMSKKDLTTRLMSIASGIAYKRLMRGYLTEMERSKLLNEMKYLNKIYIEECFNLTEIEARNIIKNMSRNFDCKFFFVDYIQLMYSAKRFDNRHQELAHISTTLAKVCKETNSVVFCVSQLSRDVERRNKEHRPILSDLRESGRIEEDADLVLLLYRPEVYGILEDKEGNPMEGICEVIIAKNRHGRLGSCYLHFHADSLKFASPEEDWAGY